MKIKLYIVTYKKNEILNENLKSLWANTNNLTDIDITILNNHPDIEIYEENKRDNLKIINNTTRMPNAWGYLSRDWNFCILDAFTNWKNPNNVDWVVLAQNDVTWKKDWDLWLRKNKKYDFISRPMGDQCLILNIRAIKNIGFFDERFTTLHFHEIDYFIRANLLYSSNISITDNHLKHNFSINPIENIIINDTSSGICEEDQTIHNSNNYNYSLNQIINKYSINIFDNTDNIIKKIKNNFKKNVKTEINWYPFFWEGYSDIEKTFIYANNKEKKSSKSAIYKFFHLYWLRNKK